MVEVNKQLNALNAISLKKTEDKRGENQSSISFTGHVIREELDTKDNKIKPKYQFFLPTQSKDAKLVLVLLERDRNGDLKQVGDPSKPISLTGNDSSKSIVISLDDLNKHIKYVLLDF